MGGGTLTISATGVLTGSGSARTLTISTNGGGPPQWQPRRTPGPETPTWNVGDSCANVDGMLTGSAGGSTFRSFNVCAQGCPRSGTLTIVNQSNGSTLTTTFNGTASVTVTSSTGGRTAAALTCG